MEHKRSKWSYAVGCTGRDLCYTLVALFFMSYIQFTNLVNPTQFAVLTAIIVLCRVWDAVNDPMMGTIISNTRTRLGKYRPWILIGAICNTVILILMFSIRVDVGTDIATLGWYNVAILGVLYLLWGMTYTMNDVSYWSLLPVLAEGKKDRDNLTTMVASFASVGSFITGGLVPMLTPGNAINAYRWIAVCFGLTFLVCQIMVFFLTHDNPKDLFIISREEMDSQPKENSINLKDMFKILFRNKQLLVMSLVVLFYSTASMFLVTFGTNFFYFKFGYKGDYILIFTIVYAVGTLLSQMIYPLIASKVKRMTIVKYACLTAVIGYTLFAIFALINVQSIVMFVLLALAAFIVFGGQGVFYMAMLVMLTNTIEYDEWKTGERNDAVIFSVRPFMVKLSSAIEAASVAVVLLACGLYSITQKVGQVEADISKEIITTEEAAPIIEGFLAEASYGQLVGLTLCMTVIPIILMTLCFIILKKKYIIDEALYEQMTQEIQERKNQNGTKEATN